MGPERLVDLLKELAAEHGEALSVHRFCRLARVSDRAIYASFAGGWPELRRAAGLAERVEAARRYSDEELLEAFADLGRRLGRVPGWRDVAQSGVASAATYQRRFGTLAELRREAADRWGPIGVSYEAMQAWLRCVEAAGILPNSDGATEAFDDGSGDRDFAAGTPESEGRLPPMPPQPPSSRPLASRVEESNAMPLLHVVLYQPDIPQNTGNVGRSCVAVGAKLWLVRPLGFRLDDRYLKRAGMDYWRHLDWEAVESWEELRERLPERQVWCVEESGTRPVWEAEFRPGDVLVFGSETRGLPQRLLDENPVRNLFLPTRPEVRSLNLASTANTVIYEAVRQFGGLRVEG